VFGCVVREAIVVVVHGRCMGAPSWTKSRPGIELTTRSKKQSRNQNNTQPETMHLSPPHADHQIQHTTGFDRCHALLSGGT
jgi:hypothetical protein